MSKTLRVHVHYKGKVQISDLDLEKGDSLDLTDDDGIFMTLEIIDEEIVLKFRADE